MKCFNIHNWRKPRVVSINQNNFELLHECRCQKFAAKIEMSTTYFAVTNYVELVASRQQFSVPYFSHGGTSLIFAAFGGVNLSFVQRNVELLVRGHGTPCRSEIVLRFEKRAISRPSKDLIHRTEHCELQRCTCQSKHHARVFFT